MDELSSRLPPFPLLLGGALGTFAGRSATNYLPRVLKAHPLEVTRSSNLAKSLIPFSQILLMTARNVRSVLLIKKIQKRIISRTPPEKTKILSPPPFPHPPSTRSHIPPPRSLLKVACSEVVRNVYLSDTDEQHKLLRKLIVCARSV